MLSACPSDINRGTVYRTLSSPLCPSRPTVYLRKQRFREAKSHSIRGRAQSLIRAPWAGGGWALR